MLHELRLVGAVVLVVPEEEEGECVVRRRTCSLLLVRLQEDAEDYCYY
jgi:hypothetical protein